MVINILEGTKKRNEKGMCVCAVSGFAILKKTVSQSLAEKVTSELRPQGYMRAFHADTWSKSLMGRRKNKCKRPEAKLWCI